LGILKLIQSRDEIILAMQAAIVNTLKLYAGSVILAKPVFIKPRVSNHGLALVGQIELTDRYNKKIILALGFPQEVFSIIYENTFQEKIDEINSETQELAGELINIIFQTIDPELRVHGHEFTASLPQVLVGQSLIDSLQNNNTSSLVLPFAIEAGSFYLELAEINWRGL
jgi:CheY-specific phosphatase CheX